VGGLPARATLVRQIREENKNVLLLDAGDFNTGTAVSNVFHARPDIEGYNYIGYDAVALGNHEFDNPADVLKEQVEGAAFPFLSANVRRRNGEYFAEPYIIKNFGEFKVAVFGLTTKLTEVIANPAHIQNVVFEDEVEVARRLVPELRKQADVVIALVHMGIFNSLLRGSERLASEVGGIDFIVDGHSHTRLQNPIIVRHMSSDHETVIVQAWKWGLLLGRLDLKIENKTVTDFEFETIPINVALAEKESDGAEIRRSVQEPVEEDPKLLALLTPYVEEVKETLSEVVGEAEERFFARDVRHQETPLGDMVADSMLWFTKSLGVDFAIQNGGGIRSGLPAGPITMRDIHDMLPFDNSVVVLTLEGSHVQALFDFLATISPGQGPFPQVSEGVTFAKNRLTGRCDDVLINGNPIDPNRMYKIATNSYLAAGGDGYRIFSQAAEAYDTGKMQRDVFADYIRHLGGRISPRKGSRIKIISDQTTEMGFKFAA
jgi:5'-nucleotidase/UDP-sugar diphosphatase